MHRDVAPKILQTGRNMMLMWVCPTDAPQHSCKTALIWVLPEANIS